MFTRATRSSFFPDMSTDLARKQAVFKSKLYRRGCKFTLRHPAVLAVWHQDTEHRFSTAEEAEEFYN